METPTPPSILTHTHTHINKNLRKKTTPPLTIILSNFAPLIDREL